MEMKTNKLFFMACMALSFLSCAHEPLVVETVAFDEIVINGRRTKTALVLEQTPDLYQIKIDGKYGDSVKIEVKDRTLYIDMPRKKKYSYSIYACAPTFKKISASLLQSLETKDTIRQDSIVFDFIDAKTHLMLDVKKMRFRGSTIQKLTLEGECDTAYIDTRYTDCSIKASEFTTKDMHISTGYGTKAKLHVTDHIWFEDLFNSKVSYVGNPEIMQCNMQWSSISHQLFFMF